MIKILLANKDEKLIGIYKRRLPAPLSVDFVFDGLTALRAISQKRPNLILSDYDLPVISGAKLLQYVRLHPIMYATPFIFFTNSLSNDDVMGLGATDWIHIPEFSPDEVIKKMMYHLRLNNQLSLNNV
jgi:DNA-binding response OmpR family regulator